MVYYIETNVIAILTGLILFRQSNLISSKGETSQILMNCMIFTLIISGLSDIAAFCSRGKSYVGVHISNIIYYLAMAVGCFFWFLFILVRTKAIHNFGKVVRLSGIPIALLSAAILINPVTSFFFSVDEALLYHRGTGVLLTWVIEWGYVISAFVINVIAVIKENHDYKKSELKGYLLFAIPLALAAVCQMVFYGTTVSQIGFMFSLILIYVNKQHFQVQRDGLTGLSNKNSFLNYRDSFVSRTRPTELTMFMIDVDKFKTINDTLGHMTGDQALADIAEILKNAVSIPELERVLLFRYAGDEFVIIGTSMSPRDRNILLRSIEENTHIKNESNHEQKEKYTISLSVGHATKQCLSVADFDKLTVEADREMYSIKKEKKRGNHPAHV